MRIPETFILVLATLAWSAERSRSQGLTLDFANNTGNFIQFNGANDAFQFNNGAGGYQWSITGETGGANAMGLLGAIDGGPFQYGPISQLFGGAVQSATVLGPLGELVINDGTGDLTGTVNFIDVTTLFKSVGIFNADVDVNVTSLTYFGTNPDLQYLVANQPATLTLSFQFSLGKSLTDLSTGTGPYDTSYSGSISAVPEPAPVALAALGGFCLLWLQRRKARLVK